MNKQQGFTLIELIMVIVILGILAATAIPKFVDLQSEARVAAVQGIAGNLGAGSAINFAVRSVSPTHTDGTTVANCTDVGSTLEGGIAAANTGSGTYAINGTAIPANGTTTCRVVGTFGANTVGANFTGHNTP